MNAPPPVFNQQQQQQQGQGQMMPQNFGGIPLAPVGERHFGMADNVNEDNVQELYRDYVRQTGDQQGGGALFMSSQSMQEMRQFFLGRSAQALRDRHNRNRAREVDVMSIPVMGRSDRPLPAQPQQQQAGRGALPGARNAQPNRPGAGMLGNYRVERPGEARGRGQQQQQQQRIGQRGRGGRPAAREEDELQDDAGSVAGRGTRKGGRSAHTDHPPGFGCKVCGGTDHTERDCAKPSAKGGDSPYCPYHQSLSGSEQHADSTCHQCVDRCWEHAVDNEGNFYERADIDRLVTDFVRFSRGGRPEPRCASIHSHWAMCVSRHIRANGLGGLDASMLPVRRSEVHRREARRELPWTQFDHKDVAASRNRFRDTHWEFDSADQLMKKLDDYAIIGTYQTQAQRRQARNEQDEARAEREQDEGTDWEEEEQGVAGSDAGNASAEEGIAQGDAGMTDASTLLHSDEGDESYLEMDLDTAQDYAAESEGLPSDDDEEVLSGDEPAAKTGWAKGLAKEPYAEGGDDLADFDDD